MATNIYDLEVFFSIIHNCSSAERVDMIIRYKYPFSAFINGSSKEALTLTTHFNEQEASVKVTIDADEPMELKDATPDMKYFCSTKSISFIIVIKEADANGLIPLKDIYEKEDLDKITPFIILIINRVLRSIRNYGTVAHVDEIIPSKENAMSFLRYIEAEISTDGVKYIALVPPPEQLWEMLSGYYSRAEKPSINSINWPDIEEAIQEQLKPKPENEFFTNSIEFLRKGNMRMAIIESIICLEIVLTRYLKAYLKNKKKIPSERVDKKFLSSQFGLTARIAGLLNLTLEENDLKNVDIDKVLKTINWRNCIVHKTGHIPEHLTDEVLSDGIISVLSLSTVLSRKHSLLVSEPKMREIAKIIADKHGIPMPNIMSWKHFASVDINLFFANFPGADTLNQIVKDISDELQALDNRFIPEACLYVRFMRFPNKVIARFSKGNLIIIDNSNPLPTPTTI